MELALPAWFEIGTYVVLLLILAIDVTLAYKRPHVPSTRESALWIGFYVALALIFAVATLRPHPPNGLPPEMQRSGLAVSSEAG